MSRTKKAGTLAALVLAVIVVVAIPAGAAGPGQTVKVKSEVTLGATGYRGSVKAANSNCVGERTVVLKQKGNGVLSRVKSKANGSWTADLEELNEKIKIPARVFAEVKPSTQATAGPIYKCGAAVSKTVEIAGGSAFRSPLADLRQVSAANRYEG